MSDFNFTGQPVDIKKKPPFRLVGIIVIAVIVLIVAFSSFATISEGYIGVQYRFGRIVSANLQPGLNFKIPFIDTIVPVDVREQIFEDNTNAYTKDTQTVENLQIKLNYYYDSAQLAELIKSVGVVNVENKLVYPQVQSILKNEIGQFKAEELIQNRATVQENIESKLSESLAQNGVIVAAFAIENIDFEDGFEEAVRAKVVAEQDALKMQNKTKEQEELAKQAVIQAQADADSRKIQADAEAYAIKIVQEQLNSSPQYIDYQKVLKWNGEFPQVMGDSVNPFVVLNDGNTTTGATTGD